MDDLFLAILAMDAYNRGYNTGLTLPGTQGLGGTIGAGTVIASNASQAAQDASYYSIAYQIGDQVFIAYRGTQIDQIVNTAINAYPVAIGLPDSPQSELAAQFYKDVSAANPGANITLIGHSSGGGLAGLIGSAFGVRSVVFDNMPFQLAASNLSSATSDDPIWGLNAMMARLGFFGTDALRPAPDFSLDSGYKVNGEFLDQLTPFRSSTGITALDSFSQNQGEFDLHSMALLATLLYAKQNNLTDWQSIGSSLMDGLFNGDIADALSIRKNNAPYSTGMMMEIAYSAIDQGTMPFGNTGSRLYSTARTNWGGCIPAAISVRCCRRAM
jgi:pimeloyl-ACP methyl ester carboxylesterase